MTQIPSMNIASAQFKANPYPFYAQLRREAPVHPVTLPDKRVAWLVTRYDDVAMLLKDERFVKDCLNAVPSGKSGRQPYMPGFVKALERNMLDTDAPDHTRLRALVHKAFTPRLIDQMRERIQTLADELLQAAQPNGSMDLIRDYALPIPAIIIAEILGVPAKDRHKFTQWSNTIMTATSGGNYLRIIPTMIFFIRYLKTLVKDHHAHPQDDLLTALVQAEEAGDALSENELLAMIFLLLIAGHETTVNLIGNGTLALLQHPDQIEKLRNDPSLIKSAVEEMLRYSSPVETATERYASQDITIAGTTIPKGEMVFAVIASANRDEAQFENPDTLDITREPNRHLAFGQGVHYCLGAPLARMEGQIAINKLLCELPSLHLKTAPESLRWRRGLILRGLESLPVAF